MQRCHTDYLEIEEIFLGLTFFYSTSCNEDALNETKSRIPFAFSVLPLKADNSDSRNGYKQMERRLTHRLEFSAEAIKF